MKQLKASLIGCGGIAHIHLAAMRSAGIEAIGVYSPDVPSAALFAEKYALRRYDSLDELLSDETDLAAVCTPSGTHAALAAAVMESGKHAVVEKPAALTEKECRLLPEAEKKTGKLCAPISQLRFSETYRNTKAAVERGAFGRMLLALLSMKYSRTPEYYAGSWRGTKAMDGGGALMNQGIHGIDVLCGIMGYPVSVCGHAATLRHYIEVEDTAAASLVFPDGALGVIDGTTAAAYPKPRRLELCGTKASAVIREDELTEAEGLSLTGGKTGVYASWVDPAALGAELHTAQYENICAAVRGEAPLYYTIREAVNTVRVIRSVYESSETGRTIKNIINTN